MVRLTYGRHLRITKRPLYLECYSRGRRYLTDNFIVFIQNNNLGHFRSGIAVPKKIGPAVLRNRIKRLVKECFRLHQHEVIAGADIVVVCKKKPGLDRLNQHIVNRDILGLLEKTGFIQPGSPDVLVTDLSG
ncbi:ribonuclease P protein component [Desulfonatronovibrio magnus]|uniref:ribonuclease P protein component n=1 Tax=Desulfonatronovibrio magnus TaxID=698827 RepID=UPI000A0331AE